MAFVDSSGLSAEAFQFQSFLAGSPLDLAIAGSTPALAQNVWSNCVPFALIGDVAGLGVDIAKAVRGDGLRCYEGRR